MEAYDPTKVSGMGLVDKLREHFHRVREGFANFVATSSSADFV